jgi:hypothetical protein
VWRLRSISRWQRFCSSRHWFDVETQQEDAEVHEATAGGARPPVKAVNDESAGFGPALTRPV